jgi:pimeloyl-ACP methyl ester carboxylesterase
MNRRYDLDWLRVIAFGLLMLFHTGMLFSTWDWHVKNIETSAAFDRVMGFLHLWRMPLLFFISGSAVWFAMQRYSAGQFFLERHKRLLLPLVFGMLVVIPPQVYHERLYHQQQYASFWDFYGTLFTSGSYPQGNLSWHHLWYVPYIWTYSMLLLPLFAWLGSPRGRPWLERVLGWIGRPWMLFLLFVPSALSDLALRPFWPGDANNLVSDWGNFSHKLTFFVAGFVLASGTGVYDLIAAHRRKFLLAGVGMQAGAVTLGIPQPVWVSGGTFPAVHYTLNNFQIWMWLLAALGYGRRYLSFNHPFLRHANEAVYPFYILHQTVIIVLGYHLAYVNWGIGLKFPLVAAATFLICWGVYALAIRPWNIMRVPFGMKLQRVCPGDAPRRNGWRALRVVWLALLPGLCSCAPHGGALVCSVFEAPSLSGNRFGIAVRQQLVVYVPPSYRNSTRRFPVVYFLPNFDNIVQRYTGGSYQGFRLKDAMDRQIRSGAAREVIVVVPNAHHFLGGSWYRNSPLTGGWEDYVVKDVVEYVDRNFRTIPAAAARGLAGHGMGGIGALELALKHPDQFSAVYALSPALFDQDGLKDSGLMDERQMARWEAKTALWSSQDETARRKGFRDYVQARLNSTSRGTFLEGLSVSYAAAVAPDLALPYPHIAFPVAGKPAESQAALLGRFDRGFGGWSGKLSEYRARGHSLKAVTLEYGGDDDLPWIRRGVAYVAGMMRSQGVPVSVAAHSGGHESGLGQRLERGMLPAMASVLTGM